MRDALTHSRATLPRAPEVELEVVDERRVGEGGFLSVRRVELVAVSGGKRSQPFRYDMLDRRALDAAVMVAHHVEAGRVHVWLRSGIRPPIALRSHEPTGRGVLWEVAAGLIEPGETPARAAARELAEELGFTVAEAELDRLGGFSLPCPAAMGEVHHYFHVRVDPAAREEPQGDGSPLESDAAVICVPLEEALDACRRGDITDAKTELALRRLDEVLGARATSPG